MADIQVKLPDGTLSLYLAPSIGRLGALALPIRALVGAMTRAEVVAKLEGSGLPFAPIGKPEEMFDDPQLAENETDGWLNGADEFMMLVKPKGGRNDVDKDEVVHWVQEAIGEDVPVEIVARTREAVGQERRQVLLTQVDEMTGVIVFFDSYQSYLMRRAEQESAAEVVLTDGQGNTMRQPVRFVGVDEFLRQRQSSFGMCPTSVSCDRRYSACAGGRPGASSRCPYVCGSSNAHCFVYSGCACTGARATDGSPPSSRPTRAR